MEPVTVVTGTAVPLDRCDVDTDQIIPSDWLKRVERTGFGKGLFAEWRDDRDFVLNDERHAGASILLAGSNFGCGSSREHAVWAIKDHGFDAVVASGFADIFRNNATKNGLVPVELDDTVAERLMQAVQEDPTLEITVDVTRLVLEAPAAGIEARFPLSAAVQERFTEGLDDIDITLGHAPAIDAFEQDRPTWLPSVTP